MPILSPNDTFWLHRPFADARSDRDLLHKFAVGNEDAVAELVRRHGPMVRGVCVCCTIAWRESLAGWLHDVAWRIANKQRASGTATGV